VEVNLKYLISVVHFYGKLGPGYSFDVAFKDRETSKLYEGLFWYSENDKIESALVIENEALEEIYKDNFKKHPDYKKYLEQIVKMMPEKSILEVESKKLK